MREEQQSRGLRRTGLITQEEKVSELYVQVRINTQVLTGGSGETTVSFWTEGKMKACRQVTGSFRSSRYFGNTGAYR